MVLLLTIDKNLPLKTPSAAYFVSLGLGQDEASELHYKYYAQYGLALRGLMQHHNIGNSSRNSISLVTTDYLLLRSS